MDEDSGVPVSEQLKQARYPSPHCSSNRSPYPSPSPSSNHNPGLTSIPSPALAQAGASQELGPRDRPLPGVGLRRRRRDHQEGVPRRDGPHGPRPAPEGHPTPILIPYPNPSPSPSPNSSPTFLYPCLYPTATASPSPTPAPTLALPPKDIDGLFDTWDPSGSGTIDFKELQKALRGSGGGGGSAPGAGIKKAVNTQRAAAALQGKAKRK